MGVKMAKGSLSYVNWTTETTYGTAPADSSTNYTNVPLVNEAFDQTVNPIDSQEIRPDRTVPGVRGGNRASGGAMTTDFGIHRHTGFLAHLLGVTAGAGFIQSSITPLVAGTTFVRGDVITVTGNNYLCITGGTESAFPTTLTGTTLGAEYQLTGGTRWQYIGAVGSTVSRYRLTANATLPTGGLTIEKGVVGGDTNFFQQWTGGRVGSGRFTVPQEGFVQCAWDLAFAKPLTSTTTAATVGVGIADEPVTGFEALVSLAGVENYDLRDCFFEISNNLDTNDYRVGSRDRKGLVEGRRSLMGQATAYFTDSTMYNLFQAETSFALIVSFYHNGAYFEMSWPECKIFGTPVPKISGQGVITATFDFRAFKQASAFDARVDIKTIKTQSQMRAFIGGDTNLIQ